MSGKVFSFWFLILAAAAHAQTSNLYSPANAATVHTRVIIVQDPLATDAFEPRPEHIETMIARGIASLTGKTNSVAAWLSLVSTQDTVGIKVFSEPGPNSGTRPAVVAAVIRELLHAGLPPKHIIVWDKHQIDLRLAGYFDLAKQFGVRVAGSAESGYDEKVFYDTPLLGNLVWGDLEFGKKGEGIGRKSFVSKLVSTDMTKIINISPMMNHNEAGVFGNLFSLATGSVDNFARFESDQGRMARAVPEIYALPALSDRVVLNITDALICQYEGEERSLLHYSAILNQLRFSRDPVALDVLSLKELDRQRSLAGAPEIKGNRDLYENAALLELGVSDLKKIDLTELH
ncbi:MAG TPA: DUF362 domain-containing protein [Verrucomicrobiae bacterium]|nr:DUF362 domain-containing protein [Verrucomicrobiae bacterium]